MLVYSSKKTITMKLTRYKITMRRMLHYTKIRETYVYINEKHGYISVWSKTPAHLADRKIYQINKTKFINRKVVCKFDASFGNHALEKKVLTYLLHLYGLREQTLCIRIKSNLKTITIISTSSLLIILPNINRILKNIPVWYLLIVGVCFYNFQVL